MNYIDVHFQHDYFVKVKAVEEISGLVVEFPSNIFTNVEAQTYVYDIENDVLSIYCNKKKIESIQCPSYAMRYFIACDITGKISNKGMSTKLIKCFDSKGDYIDGNEGAIVKLIKAPESSVVIKRELTLDSAISEFFEFGDESVIPEEVRNGFLIIAERFYSEKNNE